MGYSRNATYRAMPSTRINSKAKQLYVLVAVIVIGMIISGAVNVLPSSKPVNVATKASILGTTIKN